MQHRGRGVKVEGLLLFLASETHLVVSWYSFNLPPQQHFDFIFVLLSITFVMKWSFSCRVSYDSTCIIKIKTIKWYRFIYISLATSSLYYS